MTDTEPGKPDEGHRPLIPFVVNFATDPWREVHRAAYWVKDADTPRSTNIKGLRLVDLFNDLADMLKQHSDAPAQAVAELLEAAARDRYFEETGREYSDEDKRDMILAAVTEGNRDKIIAVVKWAFRDLPFSGELKVPAGTKPKDIIALVHEAMRKEMGEIQ
jgi:hypothetical protein